MNRLVVAVDLDGTLAQWGGSYDPNHIGDPLPGAKIFMQELHNRDFYILIFTCRTSEDVHSRAVALGNVKIVARWLQEHGMPYDGIYTGAGKPNAFAFVDDRAVGCCPEEGGEGAYILALDRILRMAR